MLDIVFILELLKYEKVQPKRFNYLYEYPYF